MCGQVVLGLPAEPAAARDARHAVAAVCDRWGLSDQFRDDLALPLSELVTNAIVHARTGIRLIVSLSEGNLEVAIRDQSGETPVLRPPRADLLADLDRIPVVEPMPSDPYDPAWVIGEAGSVRAGRGLHIVMAVAERWGVVEYIGGKDVWFRVHVPAQWTPRSPCPCAAGSGTSPGGMPLRKSPDYA